jgi:putative serine protease PepD
MIEQEGSAEHGRVAPKSRFRVTPFVLAVLLIVGTVIGGLAGGSVVKYWGDRAPVTTVTATQPAVIKTSAQPNEILPAPQSGTPAGVYALAGPAVVMLSVSSQHPGGLSAQPVQGEGSGFIIDQQGDIMTNYHVVEGASSVYVTLADGTKITASVVGTDPSSDLAVVKASIPQGKVVVATLGDSNKLVVGDPVVAIGSPFGFDQTLTAGIVSGLNRTFGDASGRPMRGLIQTDAPINPGNSGGPLLNLQGEVIGITTSIESPIRGSVGIGFAIPINSASTLLPKILKGQTIDHAWLGISGVAITPAVADSAQLPVQKGVLVADAIAGGPAAKAGIVGGQSSTNATVPPTGGDIITAVDGKEVLSIEDISGYLDTKSVGDTVTISVLRNGKPMQINVTLGAWPQSPSQSG